MITLNQLIPALYSVGVDEPNVHNAINELQELLQKLEEVPVKGRQNVDTLLGCMMAIDAIIGGDQNS